MFASNSSFVYSFIKKLNVTYQNLEMNFLNIANFIKIMTHFQRMD